MKNRLLWITLGLGGTFCVVIGALQWWKYTHFGYNGLDLGIYSQVVWSLAHGHGFASSIHDPSYLGDHLELWLIPLSVIYRWWSSPLTLLWSQTILLASAIVPLTLLAKKILSERATIWVAVLFVINPLLYNIAMYEFHGLAFALPLLCWSIWFYYEHRFGWWLISLLMILLVREDMPLVVAGWALMAAIDRRSWKWWLAPLVLAATWFPIAQIIIRQANHDGTYKYLAFYQWLGTTPSQMLTYPFRHPLNFASTVMSFNNLGTILGMMATVGFVCLFHPRRLWPLLFIVAQLLLSNASPSSFLRIHYTIPYLPFLAWAALEGYPNLLRHRVVTRLTMSGFGFFVPLFVILGPVYMSFIVGPGEQLWPRANSVSATPSHYLQQALGDVQPTDRVLTSFAYLPVLANRPALYSLNYLYLGRRQYSEIPYTIPTDIDVAVIDWQQLYEYQFFYKTTVYRGQDGPQRIAAELEQQGLHLAHRYGTVDVYRRDGQVMDAETNTVVTHATVTTTVDQVQLLGQPTVIRQPFDGHQTVVLVTSDWKSKQQKPDAFVSLRLVVDGAPTLSSLPQILGQGLTPSSEWAAGTTWLTTNTFIVPGKIPSGATMRLEVIRQQGVYRLNRLLTFRPFISNEKLLATVPLQQ